MIEYLIGFERQEILFFGMQVIGNLIAPTDNSVWKGDSNLYWLEFTNVDGLTISGGGSLDGNGASWWNNVCSKNQQVAAKNVIRLYIFRDLERA